MIAVARWIARIHQQPLGEDSGKIVTEIRRVEYLKRPLRVSGRGGVFKADVPRDALPDGWVSDDTGNRVVYSITG